MAADPRRTLARSKINPLRLQRGRMGADHGAEILGPPATSSNRTKHPIGPRDELRGFKHFHSVWIVIASGEEEAATQNRRRIREPAVELNNRRSQFIHSPILLDFYFIKANISRICLSD